MSLRICTCGHPQAFHWHNRGTKPPFEMVADTICHAVIEESFKDPEVFPVCTCQKFVEAPTMRNNHTDVQRASAGEDG